MALRLYLMTIQEMAEPLEETRTELIFATEPLLSSLASAIKTSPNDVTLVELDEIEVCLPIVC